MTQHRNRKERIRAEMARTGLSYTESARRIDKDESTGLRALLRRSVEAGASDIHLSAGASPRVRIHGEMQTLADGELSAEHLERMIETALSATQWGQLRESESLDWGMSVGKQRFRLSALRWKGSLSVVARVLADQPPAWTGEGLEPLAKLMESERGLIILSGPTGSGRSSSLAYLLSQAQERRGGTSASVEDEVAEYLHESAGAGTHTTVEVESSPRAAARGIESARRDGAQIVLTPLRDPASVRAALNAVEEGCLVLGEMHTGGSIASIQQLVSVMEEREQPTTRRRLADALLGASSQRLMPGTGGGRARVAVREILINTPEVATIIRTRDLRELEEVMARGSAGMHTMEQAEAAEREQRDKPGGQ